MDLNLLPASDPNVPSHVAKIMQMTALLTIVQQTPGLWDVQEVLRRALNVLRVGDPQTLLLQPEQIAAAGSGQNQPPPPDPAKLAAAQAKTQQIGLQHQAKMREMAQDQVQHQGELQTKAQAAALESADRQADRQAQLQEAGLKAQVDREKIAADFAKANQPEPPEEGGTATLGPF
jgi:hypothetical protein